MLEERFRNHGRMEDLENAIAEYQRAAELTEPSRDVSRSTVLRRLEAALEELRPNDRLRSFHHYKLGDALLERFGHFGRLEDLHGAISSLRKSVEFTPDGGKPPFLGRLGHDADEAAWPKFNKYLGDVKALEV
jgi:hypothetical protein